ncbi:MAG: chemotaxis protein CheW [bacterium]
MVKVDKKTDKSEEEINTIQIVSFLIDNALYGMDISNVREIIKVGKITYVPGSAEYITGVMNLRGMVIAVVDMGNLLGFSKIVFSDQTRIIITEIQNQTLVGFLVDEIINIVNVSPDKIEPPPATLEKNRTKYIKGEVQMDGELMAILDLAEI